MFILVEESIVYRFCDGRMSRKSNEDVWCVVRWIYKRVVDNEIRGIIRDYMG